MLWRLVRIRLTAPIGTLLSHLRRSIDADRPIREALELMRKHNVRRLIVTEKEDLVGLIKQLIGKANIVVLGLSLVQAMII